MDVSDAVLLGILEGLTEFLPVSSTGHLILLGEALALEGEAVKTFEIVIQAGAILAVAVYYRRLLAETLRGMLRRDPVAVRLLASLIVAFLPAAVVGLLFHKQIKALLFGSGPVVVALAFGGILMIGLEAWRGRRGAPGLSGLEAVTPKRALIIGLAQCAALWPGMSRSMSTIVGGQLAGLSTATAADFSFLLALPTLGAACAFDLLKGWRGLAEMDGGLQVVAVGLVTSFFVAWAVIAAFLRYLRRFGLAPFGWYRLALAAGVWWMVG